ncbi:helix-turn-helix transcriptional regulator [Spirillospora sp. NPDC029432]|uniref:helix-turn-helix domain-containing protein n=1 Tax=Spirillospora sp. NPDC029432 TaxID=3154599 RepID=UPI0034573396
MLRRALADAQLTEADLAERVGVDPKTVHRWLAGRTPYPRHRAKVAEILDANVVCLWPKIQNSHITPDTSSVELFATYPHRWSVPRHVWQRHFESAQHEIGVLAYAGLFLAEDNGLLRILARKADSGIPVRILLGNPDGIRITERGAEEGVGDSLAAKIRNSIHHYEPLCKVDHVEMRLHDTVLYASIYLADQDLMINPHAYGTPASHAPILHLRETQDGSMANTYITSFELIWRNAKQLHV